jgi:tRNA dimethylallyltransferase
MAELVVVIYGPTAVGKTELALKLAQNIDGAIINADVGQFYTPLTIGTAKPTVPHPSIDHYMFNYSNEPRNITVVEYREHIIRLLPMLFAQGKVPIIVGGSGFYIMSLFFPPLAGNDANLSDNESANRSWDMLHAIDPERAARIHPHDSYRIRRALGLFAKTGQKPSSYAPYYNPIAPFFLLSLVRERSDLAMRIHQRVNAMIHEGWIDEVKGLIGTAWEPFLEQKKLLGYPEILNYCKNPGTLTVEHLIDIIARKTCQYAKRQLSFGRMLVKKLEPYCTDMAITNLTLLDLDLYINKLASKIKRSWSNDKKDYIYE